MNNKFEITGLEYYFDGTKKMLLEIFEYIKNNAIEVVGAEFPVIILLDYTAPVKVNVHYDSYKLIPNINEELEKSEVLDGNIADQHLYTIEEMISSIKEDWYKPELLLIKDGIYYKPAKVHFSNHTIRIS